MQNVFVVFVIVFVVIDEKTLYYDVKCLPKSSDQLTASQDLIKR